MCLWLKLSKQDDISFTVMVHREKLQILTFEKMELDLFFIIFHLNNEYVLPINSSVNRQGCMFLVCSNAEKKFSRRSYLFIESG